MRLVAGAGRIFFSAVTLVGCTSIDLTRLNAQSPPSTLQSCSVPDKSDTFEPIYLVSSGSGLTAESIVGNINQNVKDAENNLPQPMNTDPVVDAMVRIMTKTLLTARLAAFENSSQRAVLSTSQNAALITYQTAVADYKTPDRLTHGELETFADKAFDFELRPTIDVVSKTSQNSGSPLNTNAFASYFNDYYQGKFVDRFGVTFAAPKLSTTVTDTEIADALSVIVEFVIDNVDQTPVWGDGATKDSSKTFYPGAAKTMPTALKENLAMYQPLVGSGCGITVSKADLMSELSTAAGDRAALLSGLTSEDFGGAEFGVLFLGKISIGDNQTLATVVKTVASRLAARITLASSYPILFQIQNFPNTSSGGLADSINFEYRSEDKN